MDAEEGGDDGLGGLREAPVLVLVREGFLLHLQREISKPLAGRIDVTEECVDHVVGLLGEGSLALLGENHVGEIAGLTA